MPAEIRTQSVNSPILRKLAFGFLLAIAFGLGASPPDRPAAAAQKATQTPTPTATPTPLPGPNVIVERIGEAVPVDDLNNNKLIDPSDTFRFEVVYRNSGMQTLTGIRVLADYDQSVVDHIANTFPAGLDDKDTIVWNFGELEPGKTLSVAFEASFKDKYLPQGSRTVETKYEFASQQTKPLSSRQLATLRIPDLQINKKWELKGDLNADGRPGPGDTLTYTLTVQNIGDVEAEEIVIEDDYDTNLSIQPASIDEGGVDNGDRIRWLFTRLDPETKITLVYEAELKPSFPTGLTTIHNLAKVTAKGTEPITGAAKSFSVEVIPPPTVTPTEAVPTPTEAPKYEPAGPTAAGLDKVQMTLLAFGFIAMAVTGIVVFGMLVNRGKTVPDPVRDSFILALIMGGVIILGLAGSVERSAIAGLIGTVAGYVLKSVADKNGGAQPGAGGAGTPEAGSESGGQAAPPKASAAGNAKPAPAGRKKK